MSKPLTPLTATHETPWGRAISTWTELGLASFRFAGIDSDELVQQPIPLVDERIVEFSARLDSYLSSGQETFEQVVLDESHMTSFMRQVYQVCRAIPPGETRTYGDLARAVNSPKASRAVGMAMSRNRILIVIPCHRVIGANGRLCGFSAPGGLFTKQSLLDLEKSKRIFV